MQARTKGYLLGMTAAATYGMNPLFAKPLYALGMEVDAVLFFRYLIALPIMAALLLWRGRPAGAAVNWRTAFTVNRTELWQLVVMSFLMTGSSITLFSSYLYMDVGIASTILFVYPIMVALILVLRYKERLSRRMVLCLIVISAGVLLLYRPDSATTSEGIVGGGNWFMGALMAVLSALFYAVYIVGVQHSRLQTMPAAKVTFYVLLFGLFFLYAKDYIALIITRLTSTEALSLAPPTMSTGDGSLWLLYILALALLPTAVSFLCTTGSIHYIGPTPTAILGALEPVTATLFGVFVFHEVLTASIVCGMLLIIASVTIVEAGSGRKNGKGTRG